jgi:hypothetical protein
MSGVHSFHSDPDNDRYTDITFWYDILCFVLSPTIIGSPELARSLQTRVTFQTRSQNCEMRLLVSSCLSVRVEHIGSHWTNFHEI